MLRLTGSLIAGLMLLSVVGLARAGTDQGGVAVAETVTVTGTVKAVGKEARKVTLEGSEGGQVVIKAGPEVKNFDQIDVGDQVIAVYKRSLALRLAKAGGAPSDGAAAVVETAPKGAKPAAAGASSVEVTAEVVKIDKEKRLVTLKGPEGNEVAVKVDPSVGPLDKIAVGDDVVATYTEAMAIEVRAP